MLSITLLLLALVSAATDYYKVLGVPRDASQQDIKKAFRSLSIKYHPDKPTGDKQKIAEINKAYEVLSNPQTRDHYDRYGEDGPAPGNASPFRDFEFHFGDQPRQQQQEMPHINVDLELTLEDLYLGRTYEVFHRKQQLCSHCHGLGTDSEDDMKECPVCHGSGYKVETRRMGPFVQNIQTPCGRCHGKGRIATSTCHVCKGKKVESVDSVLSVTISRGMRDGEEIRFSGFGDERPDFKTGDVVFKIRQLHHDRFERQWNDLKTSMNITLKESLLGFNRTVTHLDGSTVVVSRSGVTPHGYVLRIKGKGMPIKRRETFGDLVVTFSVVFPNELTAPQRKCIADMF